MSLSPSDTDIPKENNLEKLEEIKYPLSRPIRYIIFGLYIILNILMNVDHGTIPAATSEIKNDLVINDEILGLFGSLVFVGVIIGSLITLTLINFFNRKYLLIIFLILNTACLYTFTLTTNKIFLFINRVLVGIFQSYVSIFLPVWCDQFGVENKKTMMIACIQVAGPLGVVVGYFQTTLVNKTYGWKTSFLIQAIMIGALIVGLFFFPGKYFSSKMHKVPPADEGPKEKNEENINRSRAISIFVNVRDTVTKSEIKKNIQSESETESEKETHHNKKELSSCRQFLYKLKIIFTQPIYIFCTLTISSLYFILTAIQYWASDYLLDELKIEDENKRLYSFSVVCLTSPTLGVIIGGAIISCTGGYKSKHCLLLCTIFCCLSGACTIPVPLVNTLILFTVFLWLVLFFGGMLLAPVTGIIISSLPKMMAGSGNSFTIFFCNLLGYLPAPYVYGFFKERFGSRFAMKVCMWYAVSGVLFLSLATIFGYKQRKRAQENQDKETFPLPKENETLIPEES